MPFCPVVPSKAALLVDVKPRPSSARAFSSPPDNGYPPNNLPGEAVRIPLLRRNKPVSVTPFDSIGTVTGASEFGLTYL